MASQIQELLRFLSTSAKIPLATAMGKIKELRDAKITTISELSTSDLDTLSQIFTDTKQAKQVLAAAKRSSKKRAHDDTESTAPLSAEVTAKRTKVHPDDVSSPADLEASLALPAPIKDPQLLESTVLHSNRAPLVLAFAVSLLRYTMPSQPQSSRLSLAQAVVSANSKAKAVSIGLESGRTAADGDGLGLGAGQPKVRVMGREVCVMRRWGYDPSAGGGEGIEISGTSGSEENHEQAEVEPSLWGIDMEELRKKGALPGAAQLPIHTPQSARAYLIKAFQASPQAEEVGPADDSPKKTKKKKPAASALWAQRERNLALLLGALELLFESWSELDADELDRRAWSWYVSVRPDVLPGIEGWGGKGEIKLSSILHLRKNASS